MINTAFDAPFRIGRLSVGLVVPLESYAGGPLPTMTRDLERVRLAEDVGFAALWLCDFSFNVASFGDAGQTFDPFVYLGLLAGQANRIALGVASGHRPHEYPAMQSLYIDFVEDADAHPRQSHLEF